MKFRFGLSLILASVFLLVCSASREARGTFRRVELETVPLARVLATLQARAAANPKNSTYRFQLARAHAMGYAKKQTEVEVLAKDQSLWFGDVPKLGSFEVEATSLPQAKARAEQQLVKAIEQYQLALELDPKNDIGRLGYGWCLEQAGRTDEAVTIYRELYAASRKQIPKIDLLPDGPTRIMHEAAEYLFPHLSEQDPEYAEIGKLYKASKEYGRTVRLATPIAIPLSDNLPLSQIEDRAARVRFDADGTGLQREWSWIKPTAGWLVYDRDHSGKIDSALQMFGNVTFWMFWQHGYEPLSALDDNRDGELRGAELAGLAIWCDANRNGISEAGEVKPLSEHGIVALSCAHEVDTEHPDRIEYSPRGVTLADGTTRPTYDVRLHLRVGE